MKACLSAKQAASLSKLLDQTQSSGVCNIRHKLASLQVYSGTAACLMMWCNLAIMRYPWYSLDLSLQCLLKQQVTKQYIRSQQFKFSLEIP